MTALEKLWAWAAVPAVNVRNAVVKQMDATVGIRIGLVGLVFLETDGFLTLGLVSDGLSRMAREAIAF